MEYNKADYQEISGSEYDAGYSEKQSALDSEIQAGGWKNLGKLAAYNNSSRQQRIFIIYQALSNNLCQVISAYLVSINEGAEQEELLTEIQKLRIIQDILLNCLLLEPKGNLEKDMVPQEVWELIE